MGDSNPLLQILIPRTMHISRSYFLRPRLRSLHFTLGVGTFDQGTFPVVIFFGRKQPNQFENVVPRNIR